MKIRNQHHVSWCFAFAAADSLQYTFQIPEPISAADIAINYSKTNWSKFVHFFTRLTSAKARREPAQTGLIKVASQAIIPQGYCPESIFPSETWTKLTAANESTQVEVLPAALEMFELQKNVQAGLYSTPESLPFIYSFENLSAVQFYSLLQNNKRDHLLQALRDSVCSGKRIPFPGDAKITMKLRSRKIFEQINHSFDEKRPMTIDFFSRIFTDIDQPVDVMHGYHTVLLYGRKFDTERNECRYLLKNSKGSSCDVYDPRLQCEGGYLWIPESTLNKTMSSAVFFKKID